MLIDYFEKNKSQRASCRQCRQLITDKMRGVEEVSNYGHREYRYYCVACSGEIIKQTKKDLQNLEQTLRVQVKNGGLDKGSGFAILNKV